MVELSTVPAPPAQLTLQVEVYADLVCPWCYIGKRRFEAAMRAYRAEGGSIEAIWRPFQLDPDAPTDAASVRDSYLEKFGGAEQADKIIEHVSAIAATEGIEVDLNHAQRANTFAGHRVVRHALAVGGREAQSAIAERLMHAHFTDGKDLTDPVVLAEAAAAAGVEDLGTPELMAEYLASAEDVEQVRAELGEGRAIGITSVPTFVFQGRWAVSGAQETETLLAVFEQVSNAALGVDGCCGGAGGCACGGGAEAPAQEAAGCACGGGACACGGH